MRSLVAASPHSDDFEARVISALREADERQRSRIPPSGFQQTSLRKTRLTTKGLLVSRCMREFCSKAQCPKEVTRTVRRHSPVLHCSDILSKDPPVSSDPAGQYCLDDSFDQHRLLAPCPKPGDVEESSPPLLHSRPTSAQSVLRWSLQYHGPNRLLPTSRSDARQRRGPEHAQVLRPERNYTMIPC